MLVKAINLKNIPISDIYFDNKEDSLEAERYPIDIYQCLECLHIQQLDIVEAESLWNSYTYYSGKTPNMPRHFQEEYNEIAKNYGTKLYNKCVIEIGSNDGSLLKIFQLNGWKVLGIDPAPGPATEANKAGIETFNDFFGTQLYENKLKGLKLKPSLIVMYNAFAHMDNVKEILGLIESLLNHEGPSLFRLEVQYAKNMVENCLLPSIFHEHISHYSLVSLSRFLSSKSMYMVDAKIVDIQHGSLVVTCSLDKNRHLFPQTKKLKDLLLKESNSSAIYLNGLKLMQSKIENKKKLINQFLDREGRGTIAGYGAARSASTIITQLELRDYISVVFDENTNKSGKYIYGEGIKILNPSIHSLGKYTIIIILAWVHSEHIENRLFEYISDGGQVISLFPRIKISSSNGASYLD